MALSLHCTKVPSISVKVCPHGTYLLKTPIHFGLRLLFSPQLGLSILTLHMKPRLLARLTLHRFLNFFRYVIHILRVDVQVQKSGLKYFVRGSLG